MTYRLAFTEDPAEFLEVAGEHLAADPVLNTVLATVTTRSAAEDAAGKPPPAHPRWWVSIHDGERVVGVAMRTAPFVPHPLYVLPMPDAAGRAVAEALVGRGEQVTGVNGALPAAQVIAEALAVSSGGATEVKEHTRLHVLGDLVEPASPPGRLRVATTEDADLCLAWFQGFLSAAAEQAGRPHTSWEEHVDAELVDGKIARQEVWLWEDGTGEVVHLTSHNPPSFGVARIGPVFTPKEQRGRGYASAGVAGVSRLLLDQGAQVCLFTDQANPTSNKIYAALGYEPVVDMANLAVS
jgi:predicted GNAT family acetyltransferase